MKRRHVDDSTESYYQIRKELKLNYKNVMERQDKIDTKEGAFDVDKTHIDAFYSPEVRFIFGGAKNILTAPKFDVLTPDLDLNGIMAYLKNNLVVSESKQGEYHKFARCTYLAMDPSLSSHYTTEIIAMRVRDKKSHTQLVLARGTDGEWVVGANPQGLLGFRFGVNRVIEGDRNLIANLLMLYDGHELGKIRLNHFLSAGREICSSLKEIRMKDLSYLGIVMLGPVYSGTFLGTAVARFAAPYLRNRLPISSINGTFPYPWQAETMASGSLLALDSFLLCSIVGGGAYLGVMRTEKFFSVAAERLVFGKSRSNSLQGKHEREAKLYCRAPINVKAISPSPAPS